MFYFLRTSTLKWLGRSLFAGAVLSLFAIEAMAEPSAQDRERARGLLDVGDQRSSAKDYEAALKAYQAADAVMGVPTTGLEVGRTLEKLGRLLEARDTLIKVTRFAQRADEPKAFTTARQTADRLAAELGPRIPSLTLKSIGLPSGSRAAITLDGSPLNSDLLGVPVKVNPGTHRVAGDAPGLTMAARDITLAEGESKELELTFVAQAQPAASGASAPGADASSGSAAPSTNAPSRTVMWVAFGVGAAGIAAGTVTGLLSLSRTSKAKDQCVGNRCPPAAQHDIDSANTLANVANVAFPVGAVAIGIGIWQFFATKQPASEPKAPSSGFRIRAQPLIGVGQLGVLGTF